MLANKKLNEPCKWLFKGDFQVLVKLNLLLA